MLVGGAAGIGKSALVEDFAEACRRDGAIVLSGACDQDAIVPMQAFTEAVRAFVEVAPASLLATYVARYGSDLARLAPRLGERVPDMPAPMSIDPEADRLRVVSGVWGLVRAASEEAPVVVVVEDVHWATELTMLALRQVLRNVAGRRVILVATYRDDELSMGSLLPEEPNVERITMPALDAHDVDGLITEHLGCERDQIGGIGAALYEQAGGNPLFTVHLLDHYLETEHLRRTGHSWRLVAISGTGTPHVVQTLIGERLDRLHESTQSMLSYAAVIGDQFDLELLEAIPEIGGMALDELETAITARIIIEDGRTTGAFRFSHSIVRQAVIHGLSATRRAALHGRVGAAIESAFAADLDRWQLQLAHHFLEAHSFVPPEIAARHALLGARAALETFDLDQANGLAERALGLLDGRDAMLRVELLIVFATIALRRGDLEGTRRRALLAASEAQELKAWKQMADAVRVMSGHIGSSRFAQQIVELGNVALAGVRGVDLQREASILAAVALASATGFLEHGDHVIATRRAVEIALELDDANVLQDVIGARMLSLGCDDLASQLVLCDQLVKMGERDQDVRAQAQGWRWSIGPKMATGDKRAALIAVNEIERFGERIRGAWWGIPKTFRFSLAMLDGDFDRAEELCGQLGPAPERIMGGVAQRFWLRAEQGRLVEHLPVLHELTTQVHHPIVTVELAYAEALTGDLPSSAARLQGLADGDFPVLRMRIWTDFVLALLTEVCVRTNSVDHLPALREGLARSEAELIVGYHASACLGARDRFSGILAAMAGDTSEANDLFERTLKLEARLDSAPLQARTRYWWAWALRRSGDPFEVERARVLLDACHETATYLNMPELAREAADLRKD